MATTPRIPFASLLLAVLVTAAGCGGSGPTAPAGSSLSQSDADDAALQVAVSLGPIVRDVQTSRAGWGPTPAPSLSADPDTTYDDGGIKFESTRVWYDAAGNPVPAGDPSAVRLVTTTRASGTFESERDTATIGHSSTLDLRRDGEALRVDGAALDTLVNHCRSWDGTRTHTLWWNSALAIEAVRLGFDPASPWPLSGRMTYTAHAVRSASGEGGEIERAFDVLVVIVFDGTAQPLLVVDGTWRYRWNIATGTLTRA